MCVFRGNPTLYLESLAKEPSPRSGWESREDLAGSGGVGRGAASVGSRAAATEKCSVASCFGRKLGVLAVPGRDKSVGTVVLAQAASRAGGGQVGLCPSRRGLRAGCVGEGWAGWGLMSAG